MKFLSEKYSTARKTISMLNRRKLLKKTRMLLTNQSIIPHVSKILPQLIKKGIEVNLISKAQFGFRKTVAQDIPFNYSECQKECQKRKIYVFEFYRLLKSIRQSAAQQTYRHIEGHWNSIS